MVAEMEVKATEGRNRRELRREAFVAAAQQLFMEKGFEDVTLSEIVRRSGGSLSTLYELFESKQGLLRAVVQRGATTSASRIEEIAASGGAPQDTLEDIAAELLTVFLDPEKIALLRMVSGESLRNPEFARDVYEEVHLPFVAAIERVFARLRDAGQADIPEPQRAALFFIGMVLHPAQTRALCGGLPAITDEQRTIACAEAAALFVRGYCLRDPQ